MTKALRGVNLGGWLVLEPWITPSLFKNTNAPDEFTYCDQASPDRIRDLKQHHKSWITRQDFQWLAEHGFEAVRIPIGYWVFGDVQPFVGSVKYLDSAFGWAEEFGLKVLICLHGAPGSQNGEVHSGRSGSTEWPLQQAHIDASLKTIERLARRYHDSPALLGIELLNEPSGDIARRTLTDYYHKAYKSIRQICGSNAWVVFDDRFLPRRWQWALHWPFYRNVAQDYHHYQIFTPEDKALDLPGHLVKAMRTGSLLRWVNWHRPIIIGEWSAALDPQSLAALRGAQLQAGYKEYVATQLKSYEHTSAWFYWTYRTEDGGPWSLRDIVEQDIFPTRHHYQ